jgi:hypothetical protein
MPPLTFTCRWLGTPRIVRGRPLPPQGGFASLRDALRPPMAAYGALDPRASAAPDGQRSRAGHSLPFTARGAAPQADAVRLQPNDGRRSKNRKINYW